jgi:ribosomal protein S1
MIVAVAVIGNGGELVDVEGLDIFLPTIRLNDAKAAETMPGTASRASILVM